ncbi:hypothetical protein QWY31_04545 [Cytophagales bacterium LB-30]|uniref:Glycosyltransferase family 2 protein n=1 Tax=Shiella aurantiaca TaxID=3058365 RepID=A0ABT8F2S9_9BACT|nr:hypothetical protein [Shiella aurantiaca]MDN4164757.1 hypothetical protein [Shiella aurantiaca]
MKALICLTHYERLDYLRKFSPSYYNYCFLDNRFDFLVAIDGSAYPLIEFCKENHIPYMYSDIAEGVGINKNRVLNTFTGYDFYFFIDDDVELINHEVFMEIILFAQESNFQHISLGEDCRFFGNRKDVVINNFDIAFSDFGSGAFNFFTSIGLKTVGGFHSEFAKYKRYGHTEHSRRFSLNGLSKSSFVYIKSLSDNFIWHNPKGDKPLIEETNDKISIVEKTIMEEKLLFYPFITFSKFYTFKYDYPEWLPLRRPYVSPFLSFKEEREIVAIHSLIKSKESIKIKKYSRSYFFLFKYLFYSFPFIRYKKVPVAIFFNFLLKEKTLLKELENLRF